MDRDLEQILTLVARIATLITLWIVIPWLIKLMKQKIGDLINNKNTTHSNVTGSQSPANGATGQNEADNHTRKNFEFRSSDHLKQSRSGIATQSVDDLPTRTETRVNNDKFGDISKDDLNDAIRRRSELVSRPIPPDVKHDMQSFLRGTFLGSDRSPLAYVGYRVGKTRGLNKRDRQERIDVCFRIEIPKCLDQKYQAWGEPATFRRFRAIEDHLKMLADVRSGRKGYQVAVSEWEEDRAWNAPSEVVHPQGYGYPVFRRTRGWLASERSPRISC